MSTKRKSVRVPSVKKKDAPTTLNHHVLTIDDLTVVALAAIQKYEEITGESLKVAASDVRDDIQFHMDVLHNHQQSDVLHAGAGFDHRAHRTGETDKTFQEVPALVRARDYIVAGIARAFHEAFPGVAEQLKTSAK